MTSLNLGDTGAGPSFCSDATGAAAAAGAVPAEPSVDWGVAGVWAGAAAAGAPGGAAC
jgi:hypothetical protein